MFYHRNGNVRQPCKLCCCDDSQAYYASNHEDVRERQREARQANPEAYREYMRNYMKQRRAQPAT